MPKPTDKLIRVRKPGEDVIVEVVDNAKVQELIALGQYEVYTPDDAEDIVQEEKADANRKTRVERLVEQYGNEHEAEKAAWTQMLVPLGKQLAEIPQTMQKVMEEVLTKGVVKGGLPQAQAIAEGNTSALAKLGIFPKDVPMGAGRWNRGQLDLYYKALGARYHQKPLPAGAEEDELVKGWLTGELTQSLIEGTDASGGYLVPDDHQIEIIKAAAHLTQVWPRCRLRPTSRQVVKRPVRSTVGDVNVGTSAADELSNVTEVTITWAEKTWTMRPFDAYFPCSVELLNDADANISQEITDAAAEQFSEQREKLPLQGRGSSYEQPTGIFHASITSDSVSAALDGTKFLTSVYNVSLRYRRGANANLLALLRSKEYKALVVDLSQNYRNLDILGLPEVLENEFVTQGRGCIGAFDQYWIYFNPMMQLLTQLDALSKGMRFVFWERWDGQPVQTTAFRLMDTITY